MPAHRSPLRLLRSSSCRYWTGDGVWNKARHVSVYWTDQPGQAMKSNGSSLLTLLLFMGLAPGSALPQSSTATVAGRVMGLPNENVTSVRVALASDHKPCSFLQTYTTADGSFRFSSVRAGDYRVAVGGIPEGYGIRSMTAGGLDLLFNSVRLVSFHSDPGSDRSRPSRGSPAREVVCPACGRRSAVTVPYA
jgi:hypothetical protein